MLKVRGFSKGTHQFLTFTGPYGYKLHPVVRSHSATFQGMRFPKLVSVKEGQERAVIEATR